MCRFALVTEITFERATAPGVAIRCRLRKPSATLQGPSVSCAGQADALGAEVGRTAPAASKPRIGVLNPAGPPGVRRWLWFAPRAVPAASARLSLT